MNGDALTTKERIKDRLQITGTSFDTLLDNLILAVTSRIQQMTGRRFTQATFTHELHDGSDAYGSQRTSLIVKNAPIQQLTALEYDAGTPGSPDWTEFDTSDYLVNYSEGIIHFPYGLPRGFQNIRLTYTGGFSGYTLGISALWHFNIAPTGAVDGSNLTFTLPESADEIIVYADGIREQSANLSFTAGTSTFTLAAGRAPVSTIAVDYLTTSSGTTDDNALPADLVEVCEAAVTRIFNKRKAEGRTTETMGESTVTWSKSSFTDEDLATIRNYRRGYNL